jgi:glutamate/tyrosine decarboxylase-like PLP-dependent enzyme
MPWRDGRGWSLVFDLPGEHHDLVAEALASFANENALSYSAFPSASTFESSVISMVASVLCPDVESHGVFTSGGTESILLATKAYRDRPRANGNSSRGNTARGNTARGNTERGTSIVVPATAHPAFGKAAQLLGLRAVKVPVGPSGAVDPAQVAQAIDDTTLMVALSAPNFPFGVIDPITEVAAIAAERGVGVHVDAALGGLFLPFLETSETAPFALDVPGVTSVSVDLHKYGYGAKGASVLLFDSDELRHGSYYVDGTWPGGAYAAPGVLGTRPVGPSAAAFASMSVLGREGYRRQVGEIMATTALLQQGLIDAAGLTLLGEPAMSVFAAGGDPTTLHRLMRGLKARGWWIDGMSQPPALHFMVFPRHAAIADAFLADVSAALEDPFDLDDDAAINSYGVMVRGGAATDAELFAHLDRRFDLS